MKFLSLPHVCLHILHFYFIDNCTVTITSHHMMVYHQCLKLRQKRCRSSYLESQIINIKLKKNQQKFLGHPPKLSASDRRTYGNFQHCIPHTSVQWYMGRYESLSKNRKYPVHQPIHLLAHYCNMQQISGREINMSAHITWENMMLYHTEVVFIPN